MREGTLRARVIFRHSPLRGLAVRRIVGNHGMAWCSPALLAQTRQPIAGDPASWGGYGILARIIVTRIISIRRCLYSAVGIAPAWRQY